jgi:hypothetical protein
VTNLWSERRTEPHDVVRLNWNFNRTAISVKHIVRMNEKSATVHHVLYHIATSLIKEEIHLSEDSVGKLPLDICVLSGHAIKISFSGT